MEELRKTTTAPHDSNLLLVKDVRRIKAEGNLLNWFLDMAMTDACSTHGT
jgi:hypothetical protein